MAFFGGVILQRPLCLVATGRRVLRGYSFFDPELAQQSKGQLQNSNLKFQIAEFDGTTLLITTQVLALKHVSLIQFFSTNC